MCEAALRILQAAYEAALALAIEIAECARLVVEDGLRIAKAIFLLAQREFGCAAQEFYGYDSQ